MQSAHAVRQRTTESTHGSLSVLFVRQVRFLCRAFYVVSSVAWCGLGCQSTVPIRSGLVGRWSRCVWRRHGSLAVSTVSLVGQSDVTAVCVASAFLLQAFPQSRVMVR